MITQELQLLLDEKQDDILTGMPVPQDGKIGDIRTNVFHGGKAYTMMKTGVDRWEFSAPYTRVRSNRVLSDYLPLAGGKMMSKSKIENLGTLDMTHNATEPDDHALEIDLNAAGFGDVKALDIDYITGAISTGKDEGVILINIDESLATGGDVFALEVLATEGSANIYGLKAAALVNPIHQDSGVFADMDSALVNSTDRLTEFITSDPGGSNNVEIFSANGDTVTIGDAAKFEELEFLLETAASAAGIKPTFEFSTGASPTTWASFTPVDGTDGMRHTGVIAWDDDDISSWAVDGNSEYLIRITRTRNSLQTVPIENKIQIAAVTEYKWDKNADLTIRDISARVAIFTSTITINSNYALEGYSTGRNVLRAIRLAIQPGATPGTDIDVTLLTSGTFGFNAPPITNADDLAKSGSDGSFSLNAGGTDLTLDITETVVGVLSSVVVVHDINGSSTSELYTCHASVSSGNILIGLLKRGQQSRTDLTSIMGAGDKADVFISFVTSS